MNEVSKDTLQVIEESAAVCQNAAAGTMNSTLDFDEPSIFKIDALISKGWSVGTVNSQTIQVWGCFLGEAMRHTLKGRWVQTESGLGVAVGNHVAHPLAKVDKRFSLGESESISHFYRTFKAMVASS